MPGRRLDLSDDLSEIRIEFPYDPRILPVVREIPGRRFDYSLKSWFCPATEVVAVVESLRVHRFELSEEVNRLYRSSKGEDAASAESPPEPIDATWTVSQLNARVREVLLKTFNECFWLVGEITGFDRNRHRRHVYFELAEKEGEGAGTAIRASVSAVLFERTRIALERKIALQADPPFELQDGIGVRMLVRVELYEPRGAFQVVVEDIDAVHTLGKLAQNRARVLAELERLGVREQNRSLPWPPLPLRVGLITSFGSDAYNDFINELQATGYSFEVTVVSARMQGEALEREVVRAVDYFACRGQDFDVLAIVRGGGSRTDLLWFDSLEVALSVARCPVKIISGIGHQRDVSVVDLIAHREKTPTAAAAAIVARVVECEQKVTESSRRLLDLALDRVERESTRQLDQIQRVRRVMRVIVPPMKERLLRLGHLLSSALERMRAGRRRDLEARADRTRRLAVSILQPSRLRLKEVPLRLIATCRGILRMEAVRWTDVDRRVGPEVFKRLLLRQEQRLHSLLKEARALHPLKVLSRGFAILRDERGRIVRDVANLQVGSRIGARLLRGSLKASVTEVEVPREPQDASTDHDGGGDRRRSE